MVDFRINWTLCTGDGKIRTITPVGSVSNRTTSARLENRDPDAVPPVPIYRRAFRYIGTCREKQRLPNTESERVYLIFMIHYKKELSNAGLLAANRRAC